MHKRFKLYFIILSFIYINSFADSLTNTKKNNFNHTKAIEIQKFQLKTISVGNKKLQVEMATTEEQQQKGLMFRTKLDQDKGMLFVFEKEQIRNFWMKNTFIPLTIGFFNKENVLIDIQDMQPVKSELQTDIPSYQSAAPATYALEVSLGWFKKNNINIGSKLIIN